jgi:hypothetical protein
MERVGGATRLRRGYVVAGMEGKVMKVGASKPAGERDARQSRKGSGIDLGRIANETDLARSEEGSGEDSLQGDAHLLGLRTLSALL